MPRSHPIFWRVWFTLFYSTRFKLVLDLLDLKKKKKRLTLLLRSVASANWALRPSLTVPAAHWPFPRLVAAMCVWVCVCVFIAMLGRCGRTEVHNKAPFQPKGSLLDEFIASESARQREDNFKFIWIDPLLKLLSIMSLRRVVMCICALSSVKGNQSHPETPFWLHNTPYPLL